MSESIVLTLANPGKYLTFRLGREEYGLAILKVKEILGMLPVTEVPGTPVFVRGVINLRGMVIPVIDLRKRFKMKSAEDGRETCVVVVEIAVSGAGVSMGIVVDAVSEVIEITQQELENTPSFGVKVDTAYILGMAKTKNGVKILLDIDRVLTHEELGTIAGIPTATGETNEISNNKEENNV